MKKKSMIRAIVAATLCCIMAFFMFSMYPKNGRRVKNGNTQYIVDRKPVTGWQDIDGSRFFFSEDEYNIS